MKTKEIASYDSIRIPFENLFSDGTYLVSIAGSPAYVFTAHNADTARGELIGILNGMDVDIYLAVETAPDGMRIVSDYDSVKISKATPSNGHHVSARYFSDEFGVFSAMDAYAVYLEDRKGYPAWFYTFSRWLSEVSENLIEF